MYLYSMCHMHITYTQCGFGETDCLNLMMWSLICVLTCSLYIKIYVLYWCHKSYVFFHYNMQRYSSVWHSNSFKGSLKK